MANSASDSPPRPLSPVPEDAAPWGKLYKITVKVPPDWLAALRLIAAYQESDLSKVMRAALKAHIEASGIMETR